MRNLAFLLAIMASSDLFAQASVLEVLRQPKQGFGDFEMLNQANQTAQSQANAAAKRASLLQRRSEELRSQKTQLEDELNKLRAEHAALQMAVFEYRDQVEVLVALLEKQDFASIAAPLEKLRVAYTKSLRPKLLTKLPVVKAKHIGEAPVVVNSMPPQTERAPDQ